MNGISSHIKVYFGHQWYQLPIVIMRPKIYIRFGKEKHNTLVAIYRYSCLKADEDHYQVFETVPGQQM